MVIYSNLNGNRTLIEKVADIQRIIRDLHQDLPFLHLELHGALQICCRGSWYKYESFSEPFVAVEKSSHGALFLSVRFEDIDIATGEVVTHGAENFYPFDLIETIVIE